MITSAHICYESAGTHIDLASLADLIETRTTFKVVKTEWRGFGQVVPQLMVLTSTPFLVQIEDDPSWVPDENREFAEWAGLSEDSELYLKLSRCDARLAIQSTDQDQVAITNESITVFSFGCAVDPKDHEISNVLKLIGKNISGILNDCVNEELFHY